MDKEYSLAIKTFRLLITEKDDGYDCCLWIYGNDDQLYRVTVLAAMDHEANVLIVSTMGQHGDFEEKAFEDVDGMLLEMPEWNKTRYLYIVGENGVSLYDRTTYTFRCDEEAQQLADTVDKEKIMLLRALSQPIPDEPTN